MSSDQAARYLLRQRFRYEYPGPIENLRHRLMISPLGNTAGQRRLTERVDVSPGVTVASARDRFGNSVLHLAAHRVTEPLEIQFESTVERGPGFGVRRIDTRWLYDPMFRRPTPLTEPDDALKAIARRLRAESASDVELAAAINAFVFGAMSYRHDVTTVATTAAEAFEGGGGVCQDYAHVALAIARACGLAARYVSGHLVGEGGTHAWVEIMFASEDAAVAWSFDPTHNRRESLDYIVVAVGRDYRDVAPTSGTFTAPYAGVLTATAAVQRLEAVA